MKKRLLVLGLLNLLVVQTVHAEEQSESPSVSPDLATQILEGEFSDETKESIYNKIKDVLDKVTEVIDSGNNINGIIGIDEVIELFGDEYTYEEDSLKYDMWVALDTFKLTVSMNENNQVDYLYGNLYPTFERLQTTDSQSDLEKVQEVINHPDALPSFSEVDENYKDYYFEFIQDEMSYITGTYSMTYDWASKDLIQLEVGQANYGRANLTVTQAEIDELKQSDKLNIQDVIDVVGDNWTYVQNLQENSHSFIWQDPLGKDITVIVAEDLSVEEISTGNLE